MDNASNCDTMVSHLSSLIPAFRGTASQTRCLLHTINLIAKVCLDNDFLLFLLILRCRCLYLFFFRQPKQKKSPAANSNPKKRGKQTDIPPQEVTSDNDFSVSEPDPTEQEMLEELIDLAGTGDKTDNTWTTEINKKVSAFWTEAVKEAQKLGIQVSSEEASIALGLFPKVAGLARRLHDSSTLQEKFARLITDGQITALVRCVTTRWNTDFDCLESHIALGREIIALITMEGCLKKYLLTEKQWELARVLAKQLAGAILCQLWCSCHWGVNVLIISWAGKIAWKLVQKILNVLEMYQVGKCWVHCPFPCNVLAMYQLGTPPLAPSVRLGEGIQGGTGSDRGSDGERSAFGDLGTK